MDKKLTKKQKADLESIEYFIPSMCSYPKITDEDRIMFLEHSDKGLHKDKVGNRKIDGFNALIQRKRWRGIQIHELWEDDMVSDCPTTCYHDILGFTDEEPVSENVMKFIAKEIFQGIDKELITKFYYEHIKEFIRKES